MVYDANGNLSHMSTEQLNTLLSWLSSNPHYQKFCNDIRSELSSRKENDVDRLGSGAAWGVMDTVGHANVATFWSRKDAHDSANRLGGPPRYVVFVETKPPPGTIGTKPDTGPETSQKPPDQVMLLGPFPISEKILSGVLKIMDEDKESSKKRVLTREEEEGCRNFLLSLVRSCPRTLVEPTMDMLTDVIRVLGEPGGTEAMRSVLVDFRRLFAERLVAEENFVSEDAMDEHNVN